MTFSKFRLISYCSILLAGLFFNTTALSTDISSGVWRGIGDGANGENGVVIIGRIPDTKMVSGYYETSDVTGNISAECKFFFFGEVQDKNAVAIQIATAHPDFVREKNKIINGKIEFRLNNGKLALTIYPEQIPRSCDWLYSGLPSYIPPTDFTLKGGLPSEFGKKGDWQAVNVIRSKRAYFYDQPDDASKRKAFVVAGDLIYIYDQNQNWYYAKYQGEKSKTLGWIKKADTIQLSK